ncbi:PQQ-binding-like beta-propeller repeat protein [Streptomyces sp. NPDC048603]|uniref:serine/threonine-protein kinase n=1 Tax=Streptomyces sp. NPDC048603 TaxID=3365577 RepID=UPI0037116B31
MQSLRAEQAGFPEYAGQYRLESVLGSGGMGVVHLATSASGLKLAVKVVHAEHAVDPEFRARFRQEIAAARRVSGAFTAPVVDADADAERPWMATLFIDAPTLAERVREGILDGPEVARLGAGLAEALRDIHRAGVVHRDLKPSNVLMAADGPKVIDFGISRPYDSDLRTETGKLIGTPPFMAPEQFQRPREVGPAADVFAMGSVLVHAATGRGPFDSDSPYIVAYQVVHDEPDLTGVPPRLARIVERCLSKEPARRPSADELIAVLRAAAYPTSDDDTRAFIPQPRQPVSATRAAACRRESERERERRQETHRRDRAVLVGPVDGPAGGSAAQVPPAGPGRSRPWRKPVLWAGVVALLAGGLVGGCMHLVSGSGSGRGGAGSTSTARPGSGAGAFAGWSVALGPRGAPAQAPACSWASAALFCAAPGVAARIDPRNGSAAWTVPLPGQATAPGGAAAPVSAGGLVLVSALPDGGVRALDPATGAQRWRKDLPPGARLVPAGRRVLVVTTTGTVTAYDAATGTAGWTKQLGGIGSVWFPGPEAAPGPGLYVATPTADGSSTEVMGVEAAGGSVAWRVRTAGTAAPVGVAAGQLHLLAADTRMLTHTVVRVDLRTRAVRQTRPAAPLTDAQAAVAADGSVYVFGTSGALAAVGPDRERWRLETGVTDASRPVHVGERVYVTALDGRLLAVDADSGRLVGQTQPRMASGTTYTAALPAPVAADGKVFASAPDGSVFAVDAADPGSW